MGKLELSTEGAAALVIPSQLIGEEVPTQFTPYSVPIYLYVNIVSEICICIESSDE